MTKANTTGIKNIFFGLLLGCSLHVQAQTTATHTITTAWGNYVTTNISGHGNTTLQVSISG